MPGHPRRGSAHESIRPERKRYEIPPLVGLVKLATRSGDARFPGGLDASNALSRNLSMLMDGFFNFLVGILMTAFTPEWHRLGDLAARTIVIDARRDTGSSRAPGDTL